MGRTTRSDIPIPGLKHGTLGAYNAGCGCFECRRRKSVAVERYREKQRGTTQAPEGAPKGAGKQETLTWQEIDALGVDLTPEQSSLANLAMLNAKLIDTIEKEGRWHLLNTTSKSLRDTLKDLRATLPKAPGAKEDEDDDDDLGPIRGFGAVP